VAPGENYKLTPPEGRVLRVSSAALDHNNTDKRSSLVIYDPTTSNEHVICTLIPNVTPHSHVDLFFVGNRDVTFKVHGNGNIHLTGYTTYLESAMGPPFDDYFHDDAGDSEEDFPTIAQALAAAQSGESDEDEDDDFISSPVGKPDISVLSDEASPSKSPALADKKTGKRKAVPQQKSNQKQKQKTGEAPSQVKDNKQTGKGKKEKKDRRKEKKEAFKSATSPSVKGAKPAGGNPAGGNPTGGKAIPCTVAGCSAKYSTDAGKAQHMKAKHKIQG